METPLTGPVIGSPRQRTSPAVGLSKPDTMRSSVDLPEPERPSSPTISPSRSESSTSSRMMTSEDASLG